MRNGTRMTTWLWKGGVRYGRVAAMALAISTMPRPAAGQITGQLQMHSEPGDYIGQGQDHFYDSSTGVFRAYVYDRTGDQIPDYMTISYQATDGSHWWSLTFGTNKIGVNLAPGNYENAERAPFASAGHPGLDVFGDGRGSNTLTGQFTITEVTFDLTGASPRLVRFVASFEQRCEGFMPPLTGTIRFVDDTDFTRPTTTASLSGAPGSSGWYRGPVEVTLSATDPRGPEDVAATYYRVDATTGPYIGYSSPFIVSTDGRHTLFFWSEDRSGNREVVQSRTLDIDATAPSVTASTTLELIRNPGSDTGRVTVTGHITDALSGVDPSSASYAVTDEYGLDQPAGPITLLGDGFYSFTLLLDGPRSTDKDGRTFVISISARDRAGNIGSHNVTQIVPRR